MIEFESVSKTFRDGTTAVDNLDLTVPSGQITVIVGPSGCGKTTTLRMVNRMLEPSKGRVTWDGKPIKSRRRTTLRRQMGYVIQSGGLFPHRTVLENIATVPDLLRWDKTKSRKRSAELLGSVGLDRKLGNRYPAQLSGGQQQRVGVARALAADPLVLLMDEPFSAVDPVVRAELHEFFLGLQRELSKTIIMITHDIDEAIKLGDQVAILRVGGRLAQVGTPQQLLDEPADAFVEGFVGRDRGYRSLSFQPASALTLDHVQVARDASAGTNGSPVLVVDADAQPVGWADPSRPGSTLALGATFDPERDSLRNALDAALTSPVGLAVAVTGDPRRYAGVVGADAILARVTRARADIAESIAVGGHDRSTGGSTPAGEQPDQGAYAEGGYAGRGYAEDPDATSVRGIPPQGAGAAAATGAAVAAGLAAAASVDDRGSEETGHDDTAGGDPGPEPVAEDPDATRVSAPGEYDRQPYLDEPPTESRSDPWASGESPAQPGLDRRSDVVDQPAPSEEWPAHEQPVHDEPIHQEWPTHDEPTHDEPPAEQTTVLGQPDEASEPAPEPYGAEAPSTEDETVGTAYEGQLDRDDVLTPHEWQTSATELPPAEPTSAESDDHDHEPPR